jgi:hypothetical protein
VSRGYRHRTIGAILFIAGIALLSASAYSALIGAGSVAQLGGSGQADVPRDGVLVVRVKLTFRGNLADDSIGTITVGLVTSSPAYSGSYTVCLESSRVNSCQTATVSTTETQVPFTVTTGGLQAQTETVRVYAAAR